METVLLFIFGVVIVVIGLLLSIGLHEIGHLLPAKLFGVKVTRYMIGFGPTLWSRRKGETEYGLKAIPLGGYIAMVGMYPPAKKKDGSDKAANGFFAKMIRNAREAGRAELPRGEELQRMSKSERIQFRKRLFYRLPVWKRVVIMVGGPLMNLVLACFLFIIVLVGFGTAQPSTTIGAVAECLMPPTRASQVCTPEDPRAPAAEAGLQPGDQVVSYAGRAITSYDQLQTLIQENVDKKTTIVVEHNVKRRSLQITPIMSEKVVRDAEGQPVLNADGTVQTQTVGMIGFTPAPHLVPQPITEVPPVIGENLGAVVGLIANLPQRLVDVATAAFGPGERDVNGPISVVGVGRVAGEIASVDQVPLNAKIASLLGIIASLNVALFVFNLIPLMPLDGGHVIGALWEALRRAFARIRKRPDPGPVDAARLIPLTFFVVIVLGAMSALLIYADLVKPISLFG